MAIQYWWNQRNLADGSLKSEIVPTKILAFNNSYHGDTFGAMSMSDRSVFTMAFKDLLFEVIFIDTPTPENLHQTLQTIESNANSIAAFIYEPLVQGAGGMNMYEPSLLNSILQAVQQHNIICIADEVMTGFGRTGKLFASEYMPIKPDIICLSKGLTGGTMALGVTACSLKIYNAFVSNDKLKTFFHGHSFTANPLACTAAIASFNLLQQNNSIAIVEWITEQNIQFAQQLKQYEPSIINIRTLGTILAFEINVGKKEYLNNIATTVTQQALNEGVYIRPLGNTVYIMPLYCITKDELAKIYSTIVKIIEAV
jgi:adenosylmethionine---8-amino-7-oxononanoate aminotransferase